jgi:hypothetical protein
MIRTATILLVSAVAVPNGVPPTDVVCVGTPSVVVRSGSSDCRTVRPPFSIGPAEAPRPFVHVRREGQTIVIGEVPAGANTFDSAEGAAQRVRVPFFIRAEERISSSCRLDISSLDGAQYARKWSIEMPGDAIPSRGELHVPRAQYRLDVDCGAEFSANTVVMDLRTAEGDRLPDALLSVTSLPRISGRITTPGGAPLVALIQAEDGRLLGRPEADGSFRIPVRPEQWPRSVVVSAPGYGPVMTTLPALPSAVELPDIQLNKAAHLVISVPQSRVQAIESLEILQLRGKRDRLPHRTVSKETLLQNEFILDVAPGKYLLVLRGAGPLERFGVTVEVGAGERRELSFELEDHEVDVRTFVGDRVLSEAELVMESVGALWNTTFRTSEEGEAKVRVWQSGEVVFILESREVAGYSGTLEMRAPRVDVRVPSRTLEGKVVDAVTGEGLGEVNVGLTGGHGGAMTRSEADGTFRFVGVKPGTYKVAAGGVNGLSHDIVSVQVHEDVLVRKVRLALRKQKEIELEIVTWNGVPASGAAVVELSAATVSSLRQSDAAGKVRLPAAGQASRSVVIIAADGTLFAQSLASGDTESKVRVTLPARNSAITISVGTDADRRPIAGVSLVMRMNGVLFPGEVMHLLRARSGILLTSGEDGQIRLPRVPAGLYEFWPVRSRGDLEAILAGRAPAAPVVIAAGPGQNSASLHFSAAQRATP